MDAPLGLALALLEPTEVYEYFIITAVPAGITLLFTPILNDNVPRAALLAEPALASTKLTLSCAMVTVQAVNLAVWCYGDAFYHLHTIFAAALSFLASLAVVGFLQSSRRYAFPSTTFHNLFLATTLLYDLSMMRHSDKSLDGASIFQFAIVTLKSAYVFLNFAFKDRVVALQSGLPEGQEVDAPSLPSLWSCLSWPGLNSLPGFQENSGLDELPEPAWNLCSETIFNQFKLRWGKTNRAAADKDSDQALIKAIASTLGGMFLSIIPLRLSHVILTLAQPLLLWHILTTVFQDSVTSVTIAANLAAAAVVWICIPVIKLIFTKQSDCIVVSTRAILIAAIYDKMLRVSALDIQNSTALSQLIDGMRSIERLIDSTQDLASAIVQRIAPDLRANHKSALPITFSFKDSVLTLLKVVVLGSFLSGKQELRRRNIATKRRQARVALTSSILKQLRSIQMMGMGPALAVQLDNHRKAEVGALLEERGSRMREISLLSNAFNVAVNRISNGQQGSQILASVQQFLLLDDVADKRLLVIAAENNNDEPDPGGATPSIELVRVTVMSKTAEVILLDATLRAFRYGTTMVFGPVASGKSTVLRLILGEVAPSSGRITVPSGSMVYCDQEVWLPYVCIQNSILGSAVLDMQWYTLLIRACGLEEDFGQLPDGDMTVIGSPGCALSLSLKQRISLARAVYDCPTTIVLDDPLNGVHYDTASQIYERLFGRRGLVFKWECTVIMATSDFGHLRLADALFTVGYDGRVQSQDVTTYTSAANTRAVLCDSNGIFSCAPTTEEDAQSAQQSPSLHDDERLHRHSQDMSLYSYFQQPAGRSRIWSWSVAVTTAAIMERMPQVFWGFSLSKDDLTSAYVAGYAALGVASVVCNRIAARLYFLRISTKSSLDLHWNLIRTLMNATPEYVSATNAMTLLKLFDDDLETISRALPITLMRCLYAMAFVVALGALLRRLHSQYLPFSERLRLLEARAAAGVTVRFSETAKGIEHIRAFRQKPDFYEDFHGALTLSQKPYYYVFEARRQLEYTIALFTAAAGLATLSLAHLYPQFSSPARLGLALVSIVELTAALKFIATIWTKLEECLGAVWRVRKFCNETPVEVDEVEEPLPAQWPSRGAFEFFRVIPENSPVNEVSANVPVVDATLEGAQKIVVTARTGSGQGSLILAVLRMINYSGAIRLDDMNIKNVPRVVLRSSITTITREGLELEGTLRSNLDPFSPMEDYFTDADLISMLHRVKLWDAVQRQGGLDASMKRIRFSKAQKQLLSLARGALHRRREDTKVVLIDDAITHLDEATSQKIHDFTDGEFATCTVLMVAYDLEAIRTADTVLTVEGGAITGIMERND
ncbi:hypothetical protein LLEC1_04187 [Akanthomyces lecanii]|uniref:ABC transporter domain-containing protein n=1 Tax=Cordyceps confragosa TaxID=2714763 RepID=A0A179IPF0_CORDF|nr:hypothetical protein LLEC1_04187 [Akanthomyces lecanii]